jgi:hypothetical protein
VYAGALIQVVPMNMPLSSSDPPVMPLLQGSGLKGSMR